MKIAFNLLDSSSSIQQKILDSLVDYLSPIMIKIKNSLQNSLPRYIEDAVSSQPEYVSLLGGQLRSELGVPDAGSRINSIFTEWKNNAIVIYEPISTKGSSIIGGFSIDMIKSDFSDILALPLSEVVDDVSGSIIPWLRWLLLDGGKILIRNYKVQLGNNSRSRTGGAIMIQSDKENWRVPSQFAGTSNNNWITRALSTYDQLILDHIQNTLENNL